MATPDECPDWPTLLAGLEGELARSEDGAELPDVGQGLFLRSVRRDDVVRLMLEWFDRYLGEVER